MRPIAIFRFNETEGPAHFAEWLDDASLPWQLIAVDRGDPVPSDPRAFSGIGMMGGPMSVAEPPQDANSVPPGGSAAAPAASVGGRHAGVNDALTWIDPLSRLLRDAIAEDFPVIGHCLGGQLLAQALGARVTRTPTPEIGWIDVETTDALAQRSWFGGRARFTPFQWHYDIFDLPPGATRVLTNAFNPNQAYVIGERHIGFQCHIEMTRDLVETWCRTGADEIAGPGTPPRQSRDEILRDMPERLAELQAIADGVYARWAQGLRR